MITFDPVTPAPLSVRVVRALIPFALFFGYLLGRVYPAAEGRIPLAEVIVAGVVLIGLVFAGLVALGDLIYPATPRARRRATSEDLEITAVHAPIADAQTVVAATYAAEVARLDALIEDTQPFTPLFTHDYDPQHHTPPGGFSMYPDGGPDPFEVPGSWTSWVGQQHTPSSGFAAPGWDGIFRVPEIREQWVLGEVRFAADVDAATAQRVLRGELFEVPDADALVPGYPNQIFDDPDVLARVVREQVARTVESDTGRHHLKES